MKLFDGNKNKEIKKPIKIKSDPNIDKRYEDKVLWFVRKGARREAFLAPWGDGQGLASSNTPTPTHIHPYHTIPHHTTPQPTMRRGPGHLLLPDKDISIVSTLLTASFNTALHYTKHTSLDNNTTPHLTKIHRIVLEQLQLGYI